MTKISNKSIKRKLSRFTTNRDKLRNLAHEIACDVMRHAAPENAAADCNGTGDVTLMLELAKLMPTSWQVQLNAWLKMHSPIRVVVRKNSANCGFDPEYKKIPSDTPEGRAERLTWWKVDAAIAKPFFECVAEPTVEEMAGFDNLDRQFASLIKRYETKLAENQIKPDDKARVLWALGQLKAVNIKTMPQATAKEENVTKLPAPVRKAKRKAA